MGGGGIVVPVSHMFSDAIVGAVAGSAAAVTSVFAFYPLEVLRVHLQTARVGDGGGGGGSSGSGGGEAVAAETSTGWRRFVLIFRKKVLNRGAALRLLHTQLTSFLFYYLYRYMLKRYGKARGAVTNIISTTVASMVTALLVGVPLDGIILRTQVRVGNGQDEEEAPAVSNSPPSSFWASVAPLYQGVTPALLLCLNPAIHFTCYDYLKLRMLNAAITGKRRQLTWADIDHRDLTSAQSFVIGLIAKGVATLVCYPLLRAKVDMMTSESIHKPATETETEMETVEEAETRPSGEVEASSDAQRLMRTLFFIVRIQGLAGLYRGISVHIIHTSLRSAFSLTLRERFTSLLRKLNTP